MVQTNCLYFNGYKPCGKSEDCSKGCPYYSSTNYRILVVHLEAMGAVLRATSLLPAIKRKYPNSQITWVTAKRSVPLLENNPLIHKVLPWDHNTQTELSVLKFDIGFCIDKSLLAFGIVNCTSVQQLYGFKANSSGAIVPATPHAEELWHLGLSDQKKFFVNKKPETQLMAESLNLAYKRDEYQLQLLEGELKQSHYRRSKWLSDKKVIVGINTGCSPTIPNKKLSVLGHRKLIKRLLAEYSQVKVVLLGGPEDTERNREIALGLDVIVSPTERGLRDGLVSTAACDLIVTGDSLGMHMAIALKKYVVAWFGPTCAHEIDLYDRGAHILADIGCSPCWKRVCQKTDMCYDHVSLEAIIAALNKGITWQISSSKQHLSEISF